MYGVEYQPVVFIKSNIQCPPEGTRNSRSILTESRGLRRRYL